MAATSAGEVLDTYVLEDGTIVKAAPNLRTQALASEQLNRMQASTWRRTLSWSACVSSSRACRKRPTANRSSRCRTSETHSLVHP